MTMRYFLHDGAYHADETVPDSAVEVPRLPDVGEHWDAAKSAFVTDHAVVADMSVGASHIDAAHALKSAEAAVIASGITLTCGLLFEEAAALGVPIATLATEVLAQAAAFRATEVERRRIKTQS